MTINERVRQIRVDKHLTLKIFGEALGLTPSGLSRIERGANAPSEQTILLICEKFQVSEAWLRSGKGEKYVKREAEEEVREAIDRFLEGENPEMKIRLAKLLSTVTDNDLWILETKLWEILTGEVLTQEQVKERVLAGKRPTPEPKSSHDFTDEDAREALEEELALRKKAAPSDSGFGSSGTASA